ncbi:MAG TPA: peptide chain release factor 3 [Candidatus Goldiibacteriota bacterium]|nr:peptide chain release factor 3 [Candidatus Goldiibacteriota bacterium]HPN63681.1 peptide chain release factor 3 [Candidatus Goldiibacteriota bacterium]HRQ44506.1 peptide chain release factor 3 [Candidatus Goldiibacteriota bacterium]
MALTEEIQKRRTFAIISHPDAGKTTLTEKFLLFAGAIQSAGAVKSNKIKKTTVSDFMEIERQRGISVASAVMSFEYNNLKINLLDTPGHKDFAEDTYRTLTAVDSVILVVDGVKGVEEQTEKLMNVCRMRSTPVIVFINKLDREGGYPVDLLDELEKKLDISVCPLSWPISRGSDFKGVYSLHRKKLMLFQPNKADEDAGIEIPSLSDPLLDTYVGGHNAAKLREDAQLIEGVYGSFNKEEYLEGIQAPVFFGSALNNFGVRELLDTFTEIAPPPKARQADTREVQPQEEKFSGFVFKIHANLDLRHRDRIAFFRVCSGMFERNKFYKHVRLDTDLRFNNPASFMGQKKEVIDEAFPGDVIGLYDRGNFKIGDTLTEGEKMNYQGIPSFSPEVFRELINTSSKAKQLEKGISQLTDEGVAQLFLMDQGRRKIVGTVGLLQFDVILYRLANEYGADCRFEQLNIHKACWVTSKDPKKLEEFCRDMADRIANDKNGNPVFFSESEWMLNYHIKKYDSIDFHFTSEFKK